MKSWPEIREKDTSEVYCSTLATIHQPDCGIALAYEEFEACRREEAAFTQSGAEYTSSQCGYQARDPYATASPLPGYPPPHELISDSERSNAGFSPNWSAAGVKCQQDSRWESDATRAVSLSSRTNDLATRRPNPRGRDRQDPRVSQSRENASGSRDPYSSGYTAGYGYPQYTTTTTTSSSSSSSSYDAYSTQLTGPVLSSSCQEQARKSNSVTPYYRSKRTPTVESCNKSSSFYNSAMTFGAGLLVGVVAGYAARSAIQSLRR